MGVIWKILFPIVSRTRAFLAKLETFMLDWNGTPARPGHKAEAGVMERLQKIEGELKHNGGSSIKDAIRRVEQKLEQIDVRLDEGNKRFNEIEERLK